MSTNLPPAGWHPDPENPTGAMRWWDGNQWTGNVHPVNPAPNGGYGYGPPNGGGSAWGGSTPDAGGPGWGDVTPDNGGPAWGSGPSNGGGPAWGGRPSWTGGPVPANATFARRNQVSLTAMGVGLLYLVANLTAHFFLIGFLPILLAVRALQRKEQLAPVAIVVVVLVVAMSFVLR